jgi:broad specificity phosphatase PhoE
MEIDNQILNLIESLILKGNANINLLTSNIISNIMKMIPKNKLFFIIEKRLSDKNIYFIRHAEAMHNVLERKYNGDFSKCNVYDPKLTEDGINQTNYTIKKLKTLNIEFDCIFISPLTRAIQTYFLVKNSLNKNVKVLVTDFVREVISYCDKNKGMKLSLLKKEYKDLNFEYMTKEYWWFDLGLQKENELESRLNFNLRLRLFILWIIFRDEKNILIISHSHVFCALQDKGIYNADIQKLENKILLKKIFEMINYK